MGIEVAQIKNDALRRLAKEVDESNKNDGYIDSSEINLFTDKATALLNKKQCNAKDFAEAFISNKTDENKNIGLKVETSNTESKENLNEIQNKIKEKEAELYKICSEHESQAPEKFSGDETGVGFATTLFASMGFAPIGMALGDSVFETVFSKLGAGGAMTKIGSLLGHAAGCLAGISLAVITGHLVAKGIHKYSTLDDEKKYKEETLNVMENKVKPLTQELTTLKEQERQLLSNIN